MTNIHIGNATNSMVVGGSVNHSSLTNAIDSTVSNETFAELKRVLGNIRDPKEKETLLQAASDLEKSAKQSGYMEKYKNFMQLAANHMALITPFLPELSKLL